MRSALALAWAVLAGLIIVKSLWRLGGQADNRKVAE
jgi:hypothetical protein